MEMFYLNKYDYKNSSNICIYYDTFINVKYEMQKYAYNYILERQGDNLNKEYKNFVYEYNQKPNRTRQQLCGPFYIKKSKYDENKITVREYKKVYGYLYNNYDDINHIKLSISKANKKVMNRYWSEKFTNQALYKQVLNKLEEIYDEAQNNKMYENIFEGTKSDEPNYYTEISSSSPIEINYNNSTDY